MTEDTLKAAYLSLSWLPSLPSISNIKSNWIKRVIVGVCLVSVFTCIILGGPLFILLSALAIQLLCFNEVIRIGYNYNKLPDLPYFRLICWYFVVLANYFLCGETVALHFQGFIEHRHYLKLLLQYHRIISFFLYLIGVIVFFMTLVKKHVNKQFRILGLTHTLLIVFVLQSYMIIRVLFQGLIWLILPASLVVLNDIWAYIFGRLYGRTPLIELSPNKTWEGFIGGGIGTIISGYIFSNFMCKFNYLTCPIEYIDTSSGLQLKTDCNPSYLFQSTTYHLNSWISFDVYPFAWHFFVFALFASIIAPFGGFCASGLKRAAKVKDFGAIFPGHGGIMDRFDCQFVMPTFINVYIFTFVRNPSVELIFRKILELGENNQIEFYNVFKENLETAGLLTKNEVFF